MCSTVSEVESEDEEDAAVESEEDRDLEKKSREVSSIGWNIMRAMSEPVWLNISVKGECGGPRGKKRTVI